MLACGTGARLFEGTRVAEVRRERGRYLLATPGGTVSAEKVVYATNGYTHLLPGMRSKQLPAFAYILATRPLTADERAAIGWGGREGIEDGRNFMHFYRLTADNRVLVGGGPGLVPFAGNMDHDSSPKAWNHLERFIGETFPPLRGIGVDFRWGGAFSVTAESHASSRGPRRRRRGLFDRLHRSRRGPDAHERAHLARSHSIEEDGSHRSLVRQPPQLTDTAGAAPLYRREGCHDRNVPGRLVVRSRKLPPMSGLPECLRIRSWRH